MDYSTVSNIYSLQYHSNVQTHAGDCTAEKMKLTPKIRQGFKNFDSMMWVKEDKEKFSSSYPNFAVMVYKDK